MRKFLLKLIKAKENKVQELRASIKEAKTADEVRALGETLDAVLSELDDAKKQLAELDGDGDDDEEWPGGVGGNGSSWRNFHKCYLI